MKKTHPTKLPKISTLVRARIEQGGDRLWRMEDFSDYPFIPVAQALSRLVKAGIIQRVSKGIYYLPRQTTFGQSRHNPTHLRHLASIKNNLIPAGIIAANMLGFSTQAPNKGEVSTTAASLPRKLIGSETVVHTRRPAAWTQLTETEAALLEFMRSGGRESELSPSETTQRLIKLLNEENRFYNLVKIASSEPPRVRALLGALGEQMTANTKLVDNLRQSLNPLSRFNFGIFSILPNARHWQAKQGKNNDTL